MHLKVFSHCSAVKIVGSIIYLLGQCNLAAWNFRADPVMWDLSILCWCIVSVTKTMISAFLLLWCYVAYFYYLTWLA